MLCAKKGYVENYVRILRTGYSRSETVRLFYVLALSGSVFVKLNGFILHCHQPHPDSSRAVMEASVPCSVATPSVAEQFRDQAVLPATYLTPTTRRNEKGDHPDTIHFKIVLVSIAHSLYIRI